MSSGQVCLPQPQGLRSHRRWWKVFWSVCGSLLVLGAAGAGGKLWLLTAGARRALGGNKPCALGVDAKMSSGGAEMAAEPHSPSSMGTAGPSLLVSWEPQELRDMETACFHGREARVGCPVRCSLLAARGWCMEVEPPHASLDIFRT